LNPKLSAIALAMAGIAALPNAHAADAAPTLADLQAENQRLRQELEALKTARAAAAPAPAAAADAAPPAAPSEAATAAAPTTSPALGAVVVTSRNREEFAQKVPLPVQVLGGAQLERDDVKSVWDLPGKAPNLRLNPPGENARKVSVSIRGVGRNGANDSAEGSVGVIVDGVSLYYAGQAWNDYVDLDRIEVLRGPQGTLMGKNTTLGALNIVTKAPSFAPSSSFEVDSGRLHSLGGKFSATGPIVDGLLAWRGTFVADRANGLYTNTTQSFGNAKETWNETNRLGGRLQFLLTPSDTLSARVILDHLRSDERTNLSFQAWDGPAEWNDGTPRTTSYLGKFRERSAWFHNSDGSAYQPRLGLTEFGNSEARPQVTNQWGGSAQVDWKVAGHTLTSISAYRYQDFDIKNGGNFDQFYITNSGQQLWNRQLSQELRLSSDRDSDKLLDYQVGLYFLKARVYSDDPSYYGPDAGAWLASNGQYNTLVGNAAGRELLRASLDGVYQSSVTDARVRSLAAYTQGDWHLGERSTLSTGVRVTREHKTNRISQQLDRPGQDLAALAASNGASAAQLTAAQAVRNNQVGAPFDFVDGEPIDDTLVAANIGPSFQLNDDVLLYGSVGRGVKSGVVAWTTTTSRTPANLAAEKSLDFELGFKSLLLDRKLLLNANLYYTKISDYQTQISVLQPNGVDYQTRWTNAPGVKSRGLEVEASYQLTPRLSVSANGALNFATYDGEFLISTPEVPASSTRAGLTDLDGRQLYQAPRRSLNVGLNYEQPIGGYLGRVTFSNSYVSGTYLALNQASATWQGGYSLANLSLGLGTLDKRFEWSLLAKNLFDKEYAVSKATWSNTTAATLQRGAPRWWGVALRGRL
jgi:iron complex outermembrane recepter protein